MNNERPIEKLLRAFAKKRREDAGAPLEMHPATRRLLQGEVSRQFRKRAGEVGATSLGQVLKDWVPWLGWAAAAVVVISLGAWMFYGGQKSEYIAFAPATGQPASLEGAKSVAVPTTPANEPFRKEAELPVVLKSPPASAPAVATATAPTTRQSEADGMTRGAPVQDFAFKQNAAFDTPASQVAVSNGTRVASLGDAPRLEAISISTTRSPASGNYTFADSAGSLAKETGADRPVMAGAITVSGQAAADNRSKTDVLRNAPEVSTASVDKSAAQSSAPTGQFRSQFGGAVLSEKKEADAFGGGVAGAQSIEREAALGGTVRFDTAPGAAAPTMAPATIAPAAQPPARYYSSPVQTDLKRAVVQRFVRSDAGEPLARRARLAEVAPPEPVLASFQIEQTGDQLRVIDSDDSIYTGVVDPAAMKLGMGDQTKGLPEIGARAGGGGASPQRVTPLPATAARPAQQIYNFRVTGTNRTLKQPVEFAWNYVSATNQAQSLPQSATGGRGIETQKVVLDEASQLRRLNINGRLRLGQNREVELIAVPAE